MKSLSFYLGAAQLEKSNLNHWVDPSNSFAPTFGWPYQLFWLIGLLL